MCSTDKHHMDDYGPFWRLSRYIEEAELLSENTVGSVSCMSRYKDKIKDNSNTNSRCDDTNDCIIVIFIIIIANNNYHHYDI